MSKTVNMGVKAMKKKLIFICLTVFVAVFAAIGVQASEYRSEISVGLRYGPSSGDSATFSSSGGINVYNAADGTLLYAAQSGEELYVQMGSTGFAAMGKFDGSGIPKISLQPQNGNFIICDGKPYRGYIYLERRENGELLLINYVGTDDYVSSVLGKEMSYSWPIEALKAQAVCARNFVLCRGNVHKGYGFDVCATTHCQVYGGVESEHENTRRAVNETKGVLAKYNGQVVALYFFATSGGKTESVENVWGSPYGYLKAVDDSYENADKASKYKWSVKLTREEIEQKLIAAGVNIGTLKKITTDKVTDSGRVTQMTFHGSEGTHSVKLEKCRTILGLYSQKFVVMPDGGISIVTTSGNANAPIYALSSKGVGSIAGYSALSEGGVLKSINAASDGAPSYSINGGGYGHGVGMSQWGARGMAENGFTYDQILRHYFTGIELG